MPTFFHPPAQDRRPPTPRATPLAAAALAVFLPGACGQSRDAARLAALEAGVASARASLAVLSDAAAPARPPPPSHPWPAATGAAASPPRPPAPAGARPVAAAGLLGAGPDSLLRWFGEPDLRRPEGDAEVRLYLGAGCALDLVLYGDAGGGGMRVAHAAARADSAAAVTEADCLRGVGAGGGGRGAPPGHIARR